jgi:DNA polymerase iota
MAESFYTLYVLAPNSHASADCLLLRLPQDYDCFYSAVFEAANPALKGLPVGVQQKQIIVTCNYEARRRGLHKLQLVTAAKKACPELVILLGEDLTPFRNASKELYSFLRSFSWSDKAERLGMDEVFLDVSDMVDFNLEVLNCNDLSRSFFHLDRSDPTLGFHYDARSISGNTYPVDASFCIASACSPLAASAHDRFLMRLVLGSHLAHHLRHQLEEQKNYTSTVGVSTNKLLSKLVGNFNKPSAQTTLMPPYASVSDDRETNVTKFIDAHDIAKIPGIGFKLSHKIRANVLGRPPTVEDGLVPAGLETGAVTVRDVRLHPGMGPHLLDTWLGGPGAPKDIGVRLWELLNGNDDAAVGAARSLPRQISIEDSYAHLTSLGAVKAALPLLAASLIRRMRTDLTAATVADADGPSPRRWLARPRTLRLSTRARGAPNPDGTRPGTVARTHARTSRSTPMPALVFNLSASPAALAAQLVQSALLPVFRSLHPAPAGWDLNVVNVAATNIVAADGADGRPAGRDVGHMVWGRGGGEAGGGTGSASAPPPPPPPAGTGPSDSHGLVRGSEDMVELSQSSGVDEGGEGGGDADEAPALCCRVCGATMPAFALAGHVRLHDEDVG